MRGAVVFISCLITAGPALAQTRTTPPTESPSAEQDEEQDQPPARLQPLETRGPQAGRIADSAVGRAGQRQTRESATGIQPMARIASRVQNRVQSRIRNRIDRNYDPQGNAADPFAIAEDQARSAGRRNR